jgi:ketosteroid isomerase-like protein
MDGRDAPPPQSGAAPARHRHAGRIATMALSTASFTLSLLLAVPVAGATDTISARVAGASDDPVLAQIRARDEELARAHGSGDMATYRAGLSARYAYIDVGGKRVDIQRLQSRREDDQRRLVSSETIEEEALRLSDDVVLLRGYERSLATYYGGLPRHGATRWSAVWVREDDGVWRLVAETATPVRDELAQRPEPVPQPAAVLAARTGRWRLDLAPPMDMDLAVAGDALIATLPGQGVRFTFRPASARHFIADERPFELQFSDEDSLVLSTWGTPTRATRIDGAPTRPPDAPEQDAAR